MAPERNVRPVNRIDSYRIETAGTLADCAVCGSLTEARRTATDRALATGRLQLIWDFGAAMYVARVYPDSIFGRIPSVTVWTR